MATKPPNVFISPQNQLAAIKQSWAAKGLIVLFADEVADRSQLNANVSTTPKIAKPHKAFNRPKIKHN